MGDLGKILAEIDSKNTEARLKSIYGAGELVAQSIRYGDLARKTSEFFPGLDYRFFAAPGRTELGGNHTDHNRGRVLCGAVQLDAVACVAPAAKPVVTLRSQGYDKPIAVDLAKLKPIKSEQGKTESLVRGVAAAFADRGYRIGGFSGLIHSTVLQGSGLSSSAAIEVLIGTILSGLFNKGSVEGIEVAKIGQLAENRFFGKPCGLMDQTASAVGGIVAIDFKDPERPIVKKVDFDFEKEGYALAVVNTGVSHADLTEEYAAVPREMKAIAQAFGKDCLRELELENVLAKAKELRALAGDRALLRAVHFFQENERVRGMAKALKAGKTKDYLRLVGKSGDSSWMLLQNVHTLKNPSEQGVALALALTKEFLGKRGAARVHGGGFAGTIQAYIPLDDMEEYAEFMERVYGKGCATRLRIRPEGAGKIV